MKKSLSLAFERGVISQNYGLPIKRLAENNLRMTAATLDQVAQIASHASEQVRAAIWIALYTACRRGEIVKIKAEDIGQDTITIQAGNTKTLKTTVIPIASPLRPWLEFVPLKLNEEGLKTGFQRARAKAGLEHINFHDLRRTCGTMMIEAGVDVYVVSKILGHSSVSVTEKVYAHLRVDRMT